MRKFLPPWKSYEVPEKCQQCPYLAGFERHIQDRATGTHDETSALGIGGLQWELRGRKRRAQDCSGPLVVSTSVTFCETADNYVDDSGMAINDNVGSEARRWFRTATIEDFLGQEPPQE